MNKKIRIIGKGHYGIVFKPDILNIEDDMVTKLFINNSEYNDEVHNFNSLIMMNNKHGIFAESIDPFVCEDHKVLEFVSELVSGFKGSELIYAYNMRYYGKNVYDLCKCDDCLFCFDDIHAGIIDLVKGLDYLHQQGIVHGDVKPTNVLYENNRFVLIDYGLTHRYFMDSFNNDWIEVMSEKYPFFPTEYSLIASVYLFAKRNNILLENINDDIKNKIIKILNSNEKIVDNVLLRNRDERYMPTGCHHVEVEDAMHMLNEFIKFVKYSDHKSVSELIFGYFSDIQNMVDVHGFGSLLFCLSSKCKHRTKISLYNLSRSLTCIDPYTRSSNWTELVLNI